MAFIIRYDDSFNGFIYDIELAILDFNSQKFYLGVNSFLDLGKYQIFPEQSLIEIGSDGIIMPIMANKIKKKRIFKDLILLNKKVSFDQKMNCIIED